MSSAAQRFHPLATRIALQKGVSTGKILAGIGLGLVGTYVLNVAMTAVTHTSKPRTMTPEWAAATEVYRKQHKMDPISNQ